MPEKKTTSKKLKEKTLEAVSSVLPISLLVLVMSLIFVPIDLSTMSLFLFGAALLVVGMGLFTLGADTAMLPMGTHMGAMLTRKKSVSFLVIVAFAVGLLITMAEPDLTVLANQVQGVPNLALILTVAVGVGLFLVMALLRILFRWKLKWMLLGLYGLVFALGVLIKPEFVPMAFDSGGVTTGPMTVPFILALGVGVANVSASKNAQDDSFGLVALCSIGPVLSIMLISLFFPRLTNVPQDTAASVVQTTRDVARTYRMSLPSYSLEVLVALSPIVVLFFTFQAFTLRLPGFELNRIFIGTVYTYVGLVLLLTGVNIGFLPMGDTLGRIIGASAWRWTLVPLGMLLGYLVVAAEPAVHVLNEQVEQVTSGAVAKDVMMKTMSVGVSVSIGLAMLRMLLGFSIWWLVIPGYVLALGLTFFVDPIFTAIAFDSGGVASGPLTAAFILPLFMGACGALGGNILEDAFGVVAMVAMTPLVAIQGLGLVYRSKMHAAKQEEAQAAVDDEIFDV